MNIVDKIKKLFALASSTNPNEAALSLQMAQRLMEEHGISKEAVDRSDIKERTSVRLHHTKRPPSFEATLVNHIADSFGTVFYLQNTYQESSWIFIGREDRCEICVYLYIVLTRKLNAARKAYIQTLSARTKRTSITRKADLYCTGWVWSISRKLHSFSQPKNEAEMLKNYMENKNLALSKPIYRGGGRGAQEATILGIYHGSKIELQHGIYDKLKHSEIEA